MDKFSKDAAMSGSHDDRQAWLDSEVSEMITSDSDEAYQLEFLDILGLCHLFGMFPSNGILVWIDYLPTQKEVYYWYPQWAKSQQERGREPISLSDLFLQYVPFKRQVALALRSDHYFN